MKGLWINEKTFISFSDKLSSLSQELATRKGAIDFYSLGMYLPNPDPVLKKQGKDLTVYKELLTDAHVGGCVSSRKSGVLSLEWAIDRGKAKTRQAKIIESCFKDLDLYSIISEMLSAVLYGYHVSEVIWQKVGNYILPANIIGKPQQWFVFSENNELLLRTRSNWKGEAVPERKFLILQHNASYENPYGTPELSRCFWPVTFKKGGLKFWIIFSEKYGMPYLIGKHPRGTSKDDTEMLADMLESMVQDAIAVIPDDASIEILEAGGKSASADIYEKLIDYCDKEISIALLGQNLTTNVSTGSYAATQAHMQIRKDIIDSDRRLIEKAMNTLIKWIYELNFSDTSSMPVFSMYEEEDVDEELAARDEKLTASLEKSGLKLTKRYYQKYYSLEDEDIEEVKTQIEKPLSFAESNSLFPDQQALDDAAEDITPEELQKQMEGILKPIIDLINEGRSYEEVMEKLLETYPDMDTSEVEKMLSRAIFISELWGRLNARN